MSKKEKLITRLKSKPKDFTWKEAVSLMAKCDFELLKGDGSRRKFFCKERNLLINLHEPHPSKVLKSYVINDLIEILKCAGEI